MSHPLLLTASGIGALIGKYVFGDSEYLIFLFVVIALDLITGITKAWVAGGYKSVTSSGIRQTVGKFIQYAAFLIVTHVLCHFTVNGNEVAPLGFVDTWAFTLLMLIEVKSVYENIIAINPSLDFMKPILERIGGMIKAGVAKQDTNVKDGTSNETNS